MMMSQVSMRSVNNWNAENKRKVQPSFGAKVPKLAKFEVIDEKLWESYTKQKDPLAEKIVRMSAKWANLREKEMKSGKNLKKLLEKQVIKLVMIVLNICLVLL